MQLRDAPEGASRGAGDEQHLANRHGPMAVEKLRPVAISVALHAAAVVWLALRAFAPIATSAAAPAVEAPAAPHGLLGMRRGEAPRLALQRGRWDDLDHAPAGTQPARERTSGLLHESGGGTRASDQGVFTGKVAPDGTV